MTRLRSVAQLQYLLLVALLLWSPFPFGSVEPWARAVLHIGAALLLIGWAIRLGFGSTGEFPKPTAPLLLVLAGIGLGGMQLLPVWQGRPLSQAPFYTLEALILLITHGIFLLTATDLVRTGGWVRALVPIICLWAGGMAFLALVQGLLGNGKMYWVFDFGLPVSPHQLLKAGPFINRNHFAGWIELVLPFPLAVLIFERNSPGLRGLFGITAILSIITLLLSGSRGGLFSVAIELAVLGGLWRASQIQIRPVLTGFFIFGLLGAAGLGWYWAGAEGLTQRIGEMVQEASPAGVDAYERRTIWRNCLPMLADYPVAGVGLGAFGTAYTKYDLGSGEWRLEHAHCDYLQMLVELGLLGGLVAVGFLFSFGRSVQRGLTALRLERAARGKDSTRPRPTAWVAAVTGVSGLLVHSLVDFNLQVPSNALLFIVLVAISFGTVLGEDGHHP